MNKPQHCFYCGDYIGEKDRFSDPFDTCGASECDREARQVMRGELEDAHDELDRSFGW